MTMTHIPRLRSCRTVRGWRARIFTTSAAAILIALILPIAALASGLPLKRITDIPLPGGTERFDYQRIDPVSRRLFISHMGAGTVIVFDLTKRRVVANLSGFPGVTGITVVPSLHRAFVSVTGHWWNDVLGGGKIAAIDAITLKTAWSVPVGRFPDGSAFVPKDRHLFISDESGGHEIIIDARTGKFVKTIALDGEAGMTAYDPVSGRIFVNVQTRNEIIAIDSAVNRIVWRHLLPASCEHNHGLLIDPPSRRAFIACDRNAKLLVLDLSTDHVVQTFGTGNDPDVMAFDPVHHTLYVASESGTLAMFEVDPEKLVKLGEGYVGDNAHSVAVDPATGNIYLPIRNLHGHPVLRVMTRSPRTSP